MSTINWLLIIAVIIVSALLGGWYLQNAQKPAVPVVITPTTTPVVIPSTPVSTYINASVDRIVVTSPLPGAVVGNSFTVNGQARGGWYFEASFPIDVVSATGTLLTQMPIQAQGEWMTANFVPFATTTVVVPAYYKGPATLILRNDNPSGLPENAASISIPIVIQ